MLNPEPSQSGRLTVGRYAIFGEIARGGMATVHYGRLLGSVGFSRVVAIKRMHPHYADEPDFVAMFVDEARLVARIRHPNVVPVLDVLKSDGEVLLVMEYIEGEAFSRLLRAAWKQGSRVPPRTALAIMTGVLHGLHAAHEAKSELGKPLGMVHRDVSPHNIVVGTDGVPRVLDFGIAKAVDRLQRTEGDQIKGKIAYMSPEQLLGEPVDRRCDVYAASVVLWESLTGQRLFDADGEHSMITKVLDGRRTPPSGHADGIPEGVDQIVLKGLAYDKLDRYPTAREMAVAIEGVGPLQTPREIGEWVQQMAGDALGARAACVAELESDIHVSASSLPVTSKSKQDSASSASSAAHPVPTSEGGSTATSVMTPVARRAPRPAPAETRPPMVLIAVLTTLAAAVLAGVFLLAALLLPTSAENAPRSVPSMSVAPAANPVVLLPELAPERSPDESTLASPPAPSASVEAEEPAPKVTRPRQRPRAPASPRPSASSATGPAANCNPPYTVTFDGVRRYKPECVK